MSSPLAVIVEADGGARGNPGPAGYGAVVLDAASGAVLAERAAGLGTTTNNVAEYSGLIAGLEAALELGATEVDVRMDSKLVIEQLTGRWQVRQPHLQPLAAQAKALVRKLGTVRFSWIPRARNARADRLANQAMDAQADGRPWSRSGTGGTGAAVESAAEVETGDVVVAPEQQAPPQSWTGVTGTPTRFLLLRHAQTERSAQRRYSGRADVPLTELGERQAAAAAARLAGLAGSTPVAAVVSSPLRRSVRSAELAATAIGVELTVHSGLIETDFGEWEGLTFAEAARRDPDLHARWLTDPSLAPPGGEAFDAVHRRVRKVRDQLIAEHGPATVLVVSHVTPIKTLLRMALDAGPSLLYRLHLDVASLSIAEFYPEGAATVRLVNDTAHLA